MINLALLLSLIPPSRMVAPSSEVVNTFSFTSPSLKLPQQQVATNKANNNIDIKQDDPRGHSFQQKHSPSNQQRDSSVESFASSSSIEYAERMRTQSNNMD